MRYKRIAMIVAIVALPLFTAGCDWFGSSAKADDKPAAKLEDVLTAVDKVGKDLGGKIDAVQKDLGDFKTATNERLDAQGNRIANLEHQVGEMRQCLKCGQPVHAAAAPVRRHTGGGWYHRYHSNHSYQDGFEDGVTSSLNIREAILHVQQQPVAAAAPVYAPATYAPTYPPTTYYQQPVYGQVVSSNGELGFLGNVLGGVATGLIANRGAGRTSINVNPVITNTNTNFAQGGSVRGVTGCQGTCASSSSTSAASTASTSPGAAASNGASSGASSPTFTQPANMGGYHPAAGGGAFHFNGGAFGGGHHR